MNKLKKVLLLVEDERSMVKVLQTKLQSAGFSVSTAFDGEEALKLLPTGSFDLIIIDLIMPRMDGFQLLQELKTKGITTPKIVLTNLAQEEDKKKAISLGALEYIVKSDTSLETIVEYTQRLLIK